MKINVSVNTPPILTEFLISRNNGSNVIKVDYNDVFARKILHLLESPPVSSCKKEEGKINIEISYFQVGNVRYSSENKNYLSEENQGSIVYDWNNTFKEIFHNYVLAYCQGMKFKIPCQRKAIMSFCEHYSIPGDDINFDTLKKSWDRSSQKQKYMMKFKRACFEINHKNC
jgi:hypothetical protein